MAPRSQLEIATGSVQRLIKEEQSYRRELEQQEARIQKLEAQDPSEDENRDYMLRQERLAVEETERVFPNLKQKIEEAIAKLNGLLKRARRAPKAMLNISMLLRKPSRMPELPNGRSLENLIVSMTVRLAD
ncbi:hypothetical protein ASPCAL00415 [Aspergillus calidoustus]|uniref:Tubulin-specific chaperone A n=1 Tax=Aspergillus calidoustus TaxID=454130 RepID=A0A0U5FNG6_ASPCI|nr:hypothetical protein ASPCAL00415 [Aspergillus calidoustus]